MNAHISDGDPGALGTKRLPPQHPTIIQSHPYCNPLQPQVDFHHLGLHSSILAPDPSQWLIRQWPLDTGPSPLSRYRFPRSKECFHLKPNGPNLLLPNQHTFSPKLPTNSILFQDPFRTPPPLIQTSGTMALGVVSHLEIRRRHPLHRPSPGMTARRTWSKRARIGGREVLMRMVSAWMVGMVLGMPLHKTIILSCNTRTVISCLLLGLLVLAMNSLKPQGECRQPGRPRIPIILLAIWR